MTHSSDNEMPTSGSAGLDADALRNLTRRIGQDIDAGRLFAASILVARGGVVGYRDTIGMVAPDRPAANDDIYLMMSISKSFTASIVLRAVDQGRFTLDTRVCEILPAFAAGGKQRVTIHQLLTHMGGTFPGFAPPPPLTPAEMGDLEKNVKVISSLPAAYTPGSRVFYNPFASYAVLGQILVETDPAQRSFQDIAQQDLFDPLGMNTASYGLAVDEPRRVPVSFTASHATAVSPAMEHMLNVLIDERTEHPAGGGFGTADDIFRFAETLRRRGHDDAYRLLSQSMFDYACQNHTGDHGNGFWEFDREANGIAQYPANFSLLGGYVRGPGHHLTPFGHTASPRAFGAVGGGSTMWMVDPERELTFVFLSAGFIERLGHFQRLQQLADLALAACVD